ncbi:hypothetical protein HYU96_01740 [Candidatus Daviesbacteria bacterium]|nr:hypothetical protein [Candidatus Daviesbacteria bacterium]
MKIIYTKHALGKFDSLAILGWKFTKRDIKNTLSKPDLLLEDPNREVKIALKRIDQKHNLRIIFTLKSGIITIITFYPREKERDEISSN